MAGGNAEARNESETLTQMRVFLCFCLGVRRV